MKVIFLDIDGVLNSDRFFDTIGPDDMPLDKSRFPILKEIVDKSGAKIVLSSTWKKFWAPECEFDCVFREAGIIIDDTTPVLGTKSVEIAAWLQSHPQTQGYVIIDDIVDGWGELESHLLNTNSALERGLEPKHVDMALEIMAR